MKIPTYLLKTLVLLIVVSSLFFTTVFTTSASTPTDPGQTAHIETVTDREEQESSGHPDMGIVFLSFGVLLIAAKMGGVIERTGQPAVLGELMAGIGLSFLAYSGFSFFDQIRHNEIIAFLAEFGAVILLFQVGLESNVGKMMKVGIPALIVAIIGVVVPFALATLVAAPWLFPQAQLPAKLFIGASLVATSVGITASVFQNLKMTASRACQIVLGAAVIDDVLGLLVLSVVSALASGTAITPVSIGIITAKAFGFLILAISLGNLFARTLSALFSQIHTGTGMKLTLALTFALGYAYIATLVGLAPIVGAFAAGLILDAVHFKNFDVSFPEKELRKLKAETKQSTEYLDELLHRLNHTHVERMISSIGLVFIPMFFAYTGLQIDFSSLLKPELYISALILGIIAVAGKFVAGFGAQGPFKEKILIGISMVPRGEVGLIFASVGRSIGAIDADLYSVILLVIMITTFITPPAITALLKKNQDAPEVTALRPAVSAVKRKHNHRTLQ